MIKNLSDAVNLYIGTDKKMAIVQISFILQIFVKKRKEKIWLRTFQ